MKPKRKSERRRNRRGIPFPRSRRNKSDWAGISIGDAFKQNLDYFHRARAQRLFYRQLKKTVRAVAKLDGTGLPAAAAGQAAALALLLQLPGRVGGVRGDRLTAFLEFKARITESRPGLSEHPARRADRGQ